VDSLHAAFGDDVGLILLEPVLGEGGIHPLTAEFVQAARELDAVLCLDEIQTGVGRTGSFFAFEQLGVRPDLVTLAKGLANGLPVGALLAAGESAFEPGDHASTFGGNPVVCAAACAVVDAVDEPLLANVRARGAQLAAGLAALPGVSNVRGAGLLLGADLDRPAAELVTKCHLHGLVVLPAGERALRLAPPLVVSEPEVDEALAILQEVLSR
jgi:acetylornithine/succinyldiaminopimelate/putrescine aminotransferase